MKKLYSAVVSATGGRDGTVKASDGKFEFKLSMPKELGGPGGEGTNPEQLFAAGYSACFDSALRHVCRMKKIELKSSQVTAHVDIGPNTAGGFMLAVQLVVDLPGMEKATAEELVKATHQVCPYSNATRGNVEVELIVNT
jgi:osmotically inducible protein OsmC